MYLQPRLLATFYVATVAALQARDIACGDGYSEIIAEQNTMVCCPGVMKNNVTATYCCIDGDNECPAGKVTCFDDMSSCKGVVAIADDDYADEIKAITGKTPPSPDGGDSNSGTSATATSTTVTSEPSASPSSSGISSGTDDSGATSTNRGSNPTSSTSTSTSSSAPTATNDNAATRMGSTAFSWVGLLVAAVYAL